MIIGNDCADSAVGETFTFRFSIQFFISLPTLTIMRLNLSLTHVYKLRCKGNSSNFSLNSSRQFSNNRRLACREFRGDSFYNAIEWPIWRPSGQRPTSKWTSITCRNVSHPPQIAIDFFLVCFSSVIDIVAAVVGFQWANIPFMLGINAATRYTKADDGNGPIVVDRERRTTTIIGGRLRLSDIMLNGIPGTSRQKVSI